MTKILLTLGLFCISSFIFAQTDDFEDGTTMNWQVGNSGNDPVNISDGGPTGASDNYLRFFSNGGIGANSKLTVFNTSQWAINYINEGIDSISMDVINLGNTSLVIRIQFESSGQRVMTDGVNVPAQSGWQQIGFDIKPENLIGNNAENVLQNVTKLWIFHNVEAIFPPDAIVAQVGIDNFGAAVVSATHNVLRDANLLTIRQSETTIDLSWDASLTNRLQQVSIIDASGKRMLSSGIEKNASTWQVEASGLVSGVYFVSVIGDGVSISKQILK